MATKTASQSQVKPGKKTAGKAKGSKKTPPKTPAVVEDPELAEAVAELESVPTPPGGKRIRSPRLRSADDVRRAGARLFARALAGELPAGDASRLASVLGLCLRTIDHDLEQRLAALEDRFAGLAQ